MFLRTTPTFFLMIVLFQIYEIFKKPTNKKAPFSKGAREIEGIGKKFRGLGHGIPPPRQAEAPPFGKGGFRLCFHYHRTNDTGRF